MKRHAFLFLIPFLFVTYIPSTSFAGKKRPNILFLVTDDQRADTIGALGNDVIKTPNLDKLVRSGFVFNSAYCMGSTKGAVCNPSRHMFLSGKALFHYNPKQKADTFGEVLRRAGYVTFHISKRGNTAQTYHKAFEFSGYLNDGKERKSGHHGRTAANRAIEFLKTTWKRKNPFFVYIGFSGPHDPRVAAKQWLNLYDRDKIPLPKNYMPFHPFNNGEMLVRDEKLAPWPRTKDTVRKHLHDYYGCISSIDHNIGRIMETLRQMGELDNTIIIFTSDHGLAIGSHGLFGKQSLYEHSMRVPMIFAGPGIPKGRSDALMYLFDVFPTAVDLAGAPVPKGLDGKSFVPVLRGKQKDIRDSLFFAYRDVQRAVRKGDWKLHRYPKVNVTQLFNVRDDPHELNDLANNPKHKKQVAELITLLAQQQKHYHDPSPLRIENPGPATVDLSFFPKGGKKGKKKRKK